MFLYTCVCLHLALKISVTRRSGRKNYRDALVGSEWENVRIELSVKGNKDKQQCHLFMLLDRAHMRS